jgi:hypothetical protein
MELMSITKEIMDTAHRLQNASKEIFHLGKEKAESERAYRRALMMEILKLKEQKMPATLISDIARGVVSDMLFERDAAEVKFKSAMESMSALKSTLSALQSVLRIQEDAA